MSKQYQNVGLFIPRSNRRFANKLGRRISEKSAQTYLIMFKIRINLTKHRTIDNKFSSSESQGNHQKQCF